MCAKGVCAWTGPSAASATRNPTRKPAPDGERLRQEKAPARESTGAGAQRLKMSAQHVTPQGFGGFLHGGADAMVSGAAADVAVHRKIDVAIRRVAHLREQRHRRDHLAGLAIATLRHVGGDPGRLHRVGNAAAHALDGDDTPLDGGHRQHARAPRRPVDQDGTGSARATPQPNLVPVRPRKSRIAHNRGVSGSTSTVCVCPLTFSV